MGGLIAGLMGGLCQHPGKGLVAQVFDDQQSVFLVLGENVGGAEAQGLQMPGDGDEGVHVLLGRRRVHQYRPPAAVGEPVVAAERSIAGEGCAGGTAPAADSQKRFDDRVPLSHGRPFGFPRGPSPGPGPGPG